MKLGMIHTGQVRPQLEQLLQGAFGELADCTVVGALDGISHKGLIAMMPRGDEPRIITELADGRTAIVRRAELETLLQTRVAGLAARGARLILLLCTGEFPTLTSPVPALFPSSVVNGLVASTVPRGSRIGVLVPLVEQAEAARGHWTSQGYEAHVLVASPFADPLAFETALQPLVGTTPSLIVMDCFAYTRLHRELVRKQTDALVVLPQELVITFALQLVN
jgi:protein AroM